MSELLVLSFDKKDAAGQVKDRLVDLQKQELIQIKDACVVTRNKKGRVKFQQARNLVSGGAVGGAFWGALIGILFLMPLAGMAIGSLIGALTGKFGDIGINDEFMKEVSESIGSDESGLFLLINDWNEERVLAEINDFDPELLQTNLSSDEEERLREAFGAKLPDE
jgi:uncharacterized membrane protein